MDSELDYDQATGQVLLCGEAIGRPPEALERVKRQLRYGLKMSDRLAQEYHLIEVLKEACPSCGSEKANWTVHTDAFKAGRCKHCMAYIIDYGGTWISISTGKQGFRKVNNLLAEKPAEVHYPEKDMIVNGTKPRNDGDGVDYKASDRYHYQFFTQPVNDAALRSWQRQLRDLEIARKNREVNP